MAVKTAPKSLEGVIRTKAQGCFQRIESAPWGSFVTRIDDPLGKDIDLEAELSKFKVKEGFPKIPAALWARWVNLAFELCDPFNKTVDETTEVTVVFARGGEGFKDWKILVPRQVVGSVEARATFKEFIDIETGEVYDDYFPDGWYHAGSTHSHNTMDAFFSSVDDKHELDVPGLHVVIGNIKTEGKKRSYTLEASIVMRQRRMKIDPEEVIDLTPTKSEFHPKCLDFIKKVKPPAPKKTEGWESKSMDRKTFSGLFGLGDKKETKPRHWKPKWEEDDFSYDQLDQPFEKTDAYLALSKREKIKFLELKKELEVLADSDRIQVKDALLELMLRYA
jgi:hypothetical protein